MNNAIIFTETTPAYETKLDIAKVKIVSLVRKVTPRHVMIALAPFVIIPLVAALAPTLGIVALTVAGYVLDSIMLLAGMEVVLVWGSIAAIKAGEIALAVKGLAIFGIMNLTIVELVRNIHSIIR
jgi:hypothetical protein